MAPSGIVVVHLVVARVHHHGKVVGVFTTREGAEEAALQVRSSNDLLQDQVHVKERNTEMEKASDVLYLVETKGHLEFRGLFDDLAAATLDPEWICRPIAWNSLFDMDYVELLCALVRGIE